MRIFNNLKNRKFISKKIYHKNKLSNNTITDFLLKIVLPNFTIFSGMFLIGLPFFKLSILRKFRVSPLLLSFSKFEILVFLVALFIFLTIYFFSFFSYDIKKYLKNNSSMNNLPLITFIITLFIGLYILFFNHFPWICLFFIITSLFSLKYKRTYRDFLKITNIINILPMIASIGLVTVILFTNEYLERFIPFNVVENAYKDSKIIDVVITYHNDKPIIKKYDTTKRAKNYIDNFLPGYEYDGVKYYDVIYGKSLICFKDK